MADIVPFGKYKNQPLAVLAQDKGYCEWLSGQSWVAQRFPALHTLIVNNFAEPSETPEHNALQLCFLEEALRLKVALCMALFKQPHARYFATGRYVPFFSTCDEPIFERRGVDVQWHTSLWLPFYADHAYYLEDNRLMTPDTYYWERSSMSIAVECKPALGDDYPAVLRQMHAIPGYTTLVVENYTFQGGTIEQVRKLFQLSGILLLDMAGLAELPTVECIALDALPSADEYCSTPRRH